jgi:hypothetical protein
MIRLASVAVLAALAAAVPSRVSAQEPQPTGFAATFSYGIGGELGLSEGEDKGGAGVAEVEATLGYEFESLGLRPEAGVVLGLNPDSHFAFRPGLRWSSHVLPLQFRVAFDAANARDRSMQWRWLLIGVATELRFTSVLGLYAEVDGGAPLSSEAGVPLLVRGGASFRF